MPGAIKSPFAATPYLQAIGVALLTVVAASGQAAPIKLEVDASDSPRKILHARLQFPAQPVIFERWRRLQGPLSSVAVEPPEAETEGSHRPRVALNADWCRFMLAISKLSDILSRSWEGPRSHFGCSNPWAFVVSIRGALGFIC